ncbi:SpoIIE family protein phosphatase [Streptomyces sp. MJP52]|uniref:SpoIIE family protein phosphatase n=3 Tax=Streptomyces TaxID=1883 RepID=UPI00247687F5|nr:SpoIIE family protein phosphatase [Streptomyces sp. MJP52]MDH6227225.1 PAS domain S-box-containing protein [Streptomyces sp. MJP52]
MTPSPSAGRPEPAGSDVFAADPEVARDLATVDWAATPLGPPEGWPQSLRTAVSILLSSRFSMWMAWGPELTFFCNDAYRRDTLGQKYPWALGRPAREVWAEIWHEIGPRIDTVLTTGSATWDQGLQLFLQRSGYPEETYHTFSYSPLRDDAGQVVGMLCVVTEETERVIGERRMATLRDLGSDPSVVRTEQQMLAFAARQLGRNPYDLPFTLTYLFDGDGEDGADGTGEGGPGGGARLAGASGIAPGHPLAPRSLPPGATTPWPAAGPGDGPGLVDLTRPPGPAEGAEPPPTGAWEEPPAGVLLLPLPRQGGAPYGFLVAALNRYRPLDEGYRSFLELVAGHVAAGIASARSYRSQQRRAEELAELDRAKTVFFSNVSHEFRTPLTLIMGPLEELRTRLADAGPPVREELEVAHRNGLRMGRLVNTLLDFSQIEAGRMKASFAPVDLSAATADLAGVFRSAVERAGLTLDVDCPPLGEPVRLDGSLWEKVVLNLLGNALKYTFEGTIRVAVRRDGDHAVVTFADTGVGIPAAELPRLFNRFHRIRNSRARSHEGSGIGLALVRELVSLHGGTITAESTEGRGTVFTVRLRFGDAHLPPGSLVADAPHTPVTADARPYVQEALDPPAAWSAPGGAAGEEGSAVLPGPAAPPAPFAPAAAPAPDTPFARGAAGARVLVADDNADMRGYLTRLLTGAGYRVRAVGDGAEALEAARAVQPDLIVGDVMMPRVDGLAMVAALRADSRTAAVPVLLLSARAGQEASIEGLEAGADDYLVKPFAAAELLARVRANVELARMRGRHARWRAALVDALQEAFFVCDETGTVLEVNAAYHEILGHGPDRLPGPHRPWEETGREAHDRWARAFRDALSGRPGRCTLPVDRADGQRIWISVSCNEARDPDTGRRVVVGTFRDITAEHYAVQRDGALAALALRFAQAAGPDEALAGALDELRLLWRAGQVLAVVFGDRSEPCLAAVGDGAADRWGRLPEEDRAELTRLRDRPALTPLADGGRAHVVLEHPEGPLVLRVDLGGRRPFTPEDQVLLSLLAGRLAQGLTRAHQADQHRRTALALQRAILGPARLPQGFAVRYEPAVPPLEVGGDWYDTVPLAGGRIGIVVGDCVGRGLDAATVMGQLRSACRALLLQEAGPARTLAALDHFAAGVPGALCTTLFCGVLDPGTGRLVYAGAGHPPGILAGPDGEVTLLDRARGLPLAVRPGAERPEAECVVPPRSTLLLYTDGLVERRRRPLSEGIALAGEALQEGRNLGADELAARVMDRLAPEGGYDDDVALLLYRHPGPLELTFPAESSQLAVTRGTLRGWLQRCDLPPGLAQRVLVAAGEACANAVEHGHRDHPGGPVRLSAAAGADEIRLIVEDSGRWKPPRPDDSHHRGRGIALMNAMMQEVAVTPGETGTTVRMLTRIER